MGQVLIKILSLHYFHIIESLVLKIWHLLISAINFGQQTRVPNLENPILLKSATRLAAEIRSGELKCENVVNAYIGRISEVQPSINAVAENRFSDAIQEARQVDSLVSSGKWSAEQLALEKPLLGVPISIKILIAVEGLRCNAGSLFYKDVLAKEDALIVTKLKNAGAICLVTTNAPEFGGDVESVNRVYGRTSNPYDTKRTACGSSGGEGALVASGGSVIGFGNDIGGSIRLPSFYNGIFGHKPGRGIVSCEGMFPVLHPKAAEFVSTGPMCRYAEDLETCMKVITNVKKSKIDEEVDFSKLKIYFMLDDGASRFWKEMDNELIEAQKKVIHYFHEEHGITAKEVHVKNMKFVLGIIMFIFRDAIHSTLGEMMVAPEFSFWTEGMKSLIGRSKFGFLFLLTCAAFEFPLLKSKRMLAEAQRLLHDTDEQFKYILDESSVFLYPSSYTTAQYHHEPLLSCLRIAKYTALFSILGMPVTQCPLGLSKNGLPLGIQVVGGRGNDHLTISVAKELEKAFGGWVPPNTNSS